MTVNWVLPDQVNQAAPQLAATYDMSVVDQQTGRWYVRDTRASTQPSGVRSRSVVMPVGAARDRVRREAIRTSRKRRRAPPGADHKENHKEIWVAVITGVFLILAEIIQHLVTVWVR